MDMNDFIKLVDEVIEEIRKRLTVKAKEYARGDRLSNFKRAGAMRNITPEDALLGMQAKHTIAIEDFVDDIKIGKIVSFEQFWEKCIDRIDYDILLLGLIQDRILKTTTKIDFKWGKEKKNKGK